MKRKHNRQHKQRCLQILGSNQTDVSQQSRIERYKQRSKHSGDVAGHVTCQPVAKTDSQCKKQPLHKIDGEVGSPPAHR